MNTGTPGTTNVRVRAFGGVVALALVSGSSFLFIKVAVVSIHPLYVALGRTGVGAVALLLFATARRHPLPRGGRLWAHLGIAAALGLVAPFTLLAYGEQHLASALAGVWNATTPLMVLPMATLVFGVERLSRRAATGPVLGTTGVLLVLGVGQAHTGDLVGHLLCLAAAGCYGVWRSRTRGDTSREPSTLECLWPAGSCSSLWPR